MTPVTLLLVITAVSARYDSGFRDVPPEVTYSAGAYPMKQTPRNDARLYQHTTLPNGLQVVNVYDPKSTQVAMSVAVSAGSYYDPGSYLGLAHLTEHAMFLGSEKYAKQSGFDEFLAAHGGASNAYTAEETTVYYAALDATGFDEGMARFGDVFADPLFNADWVWDEVSAVNSEHQKNKKSGAWRTQQILMSQANSGSPVSTFHTGDISTLKQGTKEQLVGNMSEYFAKNYCPPRMRLVTFGPMSPDKQLELAKKNFGGIPELGRTGKCPKEPQTFASTKPWPNASKQKFLRIKGLSTMPELHLLFPAPSMSNWFRSHPSAYLEEVLGFAGKNSLRTMLRDDLNLASDVAFSGEDSSATSLIEVAFTLLPEGPNHLETILDAFFSFVDKVRASPQDEKEQMMTSIAKTSQLGYDWSALPDPENTASGLAEQMIRMGKSDLLIADSLILENIQSITGKIEFLLERLRPENMLVALVDTENEAYWSHQPDDAKILPHYDAAYTVQNLSTVFSGWKKWQGSSDATLGEELQMLQASTTKLSETPDTVASRFKNVTATSSTNLLRYFVPGAIADLPVPSMELAMAKKGESQLGKLWGEPPLKMVGGSHVPEKVELWYRSGWMLPTPRIDLSLMLQRPQDPNPEANTAGKSLQLEVGLRMLSEQMDMTLAQLKRTGVDWSFTAGSKSLSLQMSAFASPEAAGGFQQVLAELKKGLDPEEENGSGARRLKRIIQAYKLELEDHTAAALSVAVGYRDILLTPGSHSKAEMKELLEKGGDLLAGKSLAEAINQRKQGNLSVVGLVMGALSKESAMDMQVKVLDELGVNSGKVTVADPESAERVRRVLKPAGPVELRAKNPRGDATNVMMMSILLGSVDLKTRVLLNFVTSVLEQVVFAELRTRLQLGYTVGAQVGSASNVLTVSCFVQSEVAPPDEAEALCERTLAKNVTEALENMSGENFNLTKQSFVSGLLQAPMATSNEQSHFWSPILLGKCLKLDEAMLEFAEAARKEDMVKAWKKAISSADERKKITVKLFGSKHENLTEAPPSSEEKEQLWKKMEVPEPTIVLAMREKQKTTQLKGAASSQHREELRQTKTDKDYFEQTLHCDTEDKPFEADKSAPAHEKSHDEDPHKQEGKGKSDSSSGDSDDATFTVASDNVKGVSHPVELHSKVPQSEATVATAPVATATASLDVGNAHLAQAASLLRREVEIHDHGHATNDADDSDDGALE